MLYFNSSSCDFPFLSSYKTYIYLYLVTVAWKCGKLIDSSIQSIVSFDIFYIFGFTHTLYSEGIIFDVGGNITNKLYSKFN